jgi:Ca2+-binding RTX toxin-like protein
MAFGFNGFAPLTNTPTLISFKATGLWPLQNVELRINGSGMTYNATTGVMTGTVTSFQIFDVRQNAVLQTTTIDPAQTGNIAAIVTGFLADVLTYKNAVRTWAADMQYSTEADNHFNLAGTQLIIDLRNEAGTIVGKLEFNGTGIFPQSLNNGVLISVRHLDAAGNLIAGHTADFSADPLQANAISYVYGDVEQFQQLFLVGSNTLTAAPANGNFPGDNALEGGPGNDTFVGDPTNGGFVSYNFASSGVTVNLQTNSTSGGAGNDTFSNIGGILGSRFDDTITGLDTNGDMLLGHEGNDTIFGGGGHDFISGESFDDEAVGSNDNLFGGAGSDTIDFQNATGNLVFTLSATGGATVTATGIGTDTFDGFENVQAGSGNDNITGNGDSNLLTPGDGNDTIDGAGGSDTVNLFQLRSVYTYTDVAGVLTFTNLVNGEIDIISNVENFSFLSQFFAVGSLAFAEVTLGASNDIHVATAGNDLIRSGDGDDIVYTLGGHDTAIGGIGGDVLVLGVGEDTASGEAGNDYVYAGDGSDALIGGAGGDVLLGESGSDNLYGGDDGDYLFGGIGEDNLEGGAGVDIMFGDSEADFLQGGADRDYLYGGAGEDALVGGDGSDVVITLGENIGQTYGDVIDVEAGDDYVYASDSNDFVKGGSGSDLILGFGGDDVIEGGSGVDYIYGGAGNDTYNVGLGGGTELVYDFLTGGGDDTVALYGPGLNTFAQVQAAMSYVAGINTTIISLPDGSNVWLIGVAPGNLTAADFVFG